MRKKSTLRLARLGSFFFRHLSVFPVCRSLRVAVTVLSTLTAGTVTAMTGGVVTGSTSWNEPDFGTGIVVEAGYFFKDTMFYSRGRGGWCLDAAKTFLLPYHFGLWVGAGVLTAEGTMRMTSSAGFDADTTFRTQAFSGEVGILTPWTPFPVAVMVYRHDTRISDRCIGGPYDRKTLSGSKSGFGWGIIVRILLELFGGGERKGPHGLGVVIGYAGLADLSKVDITTEGDGGAKAIHRKWKPVAGESIRAGLEYEF